MPYTRTLFVALLVACFAIAAFMTPDQYFEGGAFWYAVLLTALLLCLAATRDFFLEFFTVLFAAYYVQRIIVLAFDPKQFGYYDSIVLTPAVVTQALRFLVASVAAMIAGWSLARIRLRGRLRVRRTVPEDPPVFSSGKYSISFERLFLYYVIIAGSLIVLQMALLAGLGVGAASVVYDRALAPVYRLSSIMNSTGFLPFYAVARRQSSRNIRIVALLFICLQLSLAIAATSKGTVIVVAAYSIICWHFAGRRIPPVMAWLGLAAVLFTAFVFYPAMAVTRMVVKTVLTDPHGWRNLFATIAWAREVAVTPTAISLSWRLGGFDWLLGLMSFGREQFPHYISMGGDFIHVLNDLVPGDIITVPGYLPVEQLMPMYLRGIPTVEALGGHAEVMGIAGMAYLYYGLTFGPVFFLVWSFVTTRVLKSRIATIVKILYFSCFVVVMLISGGLIVTIERFYEGLLTLAFLVLGDLFVRHLLFAVLRQRPRVPAVSTEMTASGKIGTEPR